MRTRGQLPTRRGHPAEQDPTLNDQEVQLVAVKMRLQRKGARHRPFFRIVAADERRPRDGRFLEQIGHYDPLTDPPEISVDTDKALEWFRKGAQPTETVRSLFSRVGIMRIWHEVKLGKPLDEVRHLEEEARKRIEAQAATVRRKGEEAGRGKVEAAADVAQHAEAEAGAPAEEGEASSAGRPGEAAASEASADATSKESEQTEEAPDEEGASEAPQKAGEGQAPA